MRTIPFESRKSSSITLSFGLSCRGFFCRGDTGVFTVADCRFSCGSYRKRYVSFPVMIRLRNVGSSSALLFRSLQIIMRSSHWSCVRMYGTVCWVTRDILAKSQNIRCQLMPVLSQPECKGNDLTTNRVLCLQTNGLGAFKGKTFKRNITF